MCHKCKDYTRLANSKDGLCDKGREIRNNQTKEAWLAEEEERKVWDKRGSFDSWYRTDRYRIEQAKWNYSTRRRG